MDSSTKTRLKKKLKDKKNKRTGVSGSLPSFEDDGEESLFNMLNQVNQMLKQNPDMVKKVSKCVNSIFENKDLMNSLVSEIEQNVESNKEVSEETAQTFSSNNEELLTEAVLKLSTQ